MTVVYNVLEFPSSLAVRREVLGTRTGVTIGGIHGALWMPRAPDRVDSSWTALPGPSVADLDRIERLTDRRDDDRDVPMWGRPASWSSKDGRINIAGVDRALLRFTVESSVHRDDVVGFAERVTAGLDAWYDVAVGWLEHLTGQDLDDRHPLESVSLPSRIAGPTWIARNEETGEANYHHHVGRIGITMPDPDAAIDKRSWKVALSAASEDQDLPDAFHLLVSARRSLRRHHHRRAVLDAATAVEVAIGPKVDVVLRENASGPIADYILGRHRGFGRLRQLIRLLGLWLPEGLYEALFDLRNQAIHANVTPDRDAAARAIELAGATVEHHVPLTNT